MQAIYKVKFVMLLSLEFIVKKNQETKRTLKWQQH